MHINGTIDDKKLIDFIITKIESELDEGIVKAEKFDSGYQIKFEAFEVEIVDYVIWSFIGTYNNSLFRIVLKPSSKQKRRMTKIVESLDEEYDNEREKVLHDILHMITE